MLDAMKAPSEYPYINLFKIGGPPKTNILQPNEAIQIKYRKILSMIIIAYFLCSPQSECKGLSQ